MASKNQPGVITIVLEHAADLKRKDFILSKQDPYVILKCGCQEYTSKTARHGGKNPVWNETVKFEIVNETHAEITIMDEDEHSSDDLIGTCTIPFSKVRETGNEHMQIPVIYKRGKEKGFISVRLSYESKASRPSSSQPAAPSGPQTVGYALMPVMPGMAAGMPGALMPGMPGAPMPGMPGMPYPAGTMFTAPPVIPATAVPSAQ